MKGYSCPTRRRTSHEPDSNDDASPRARVKRPAPAVGAARQIVFRTAGRKRGPITRLASPSDVGEMIKPFVFLDRAEVPFTGQQFMGIHPHSGIATLTTVLAGGLAYEDTTGKKGEVREGGLEWMRAGNGVWHDGGALEGKPLRVFQLWVALPASEENGPAESQYIAPEGVQEDGPVRVVLGRYGRARSVIRAPEGIDYFHIRLKDGETGVTRRRPATTSRGSPSMKVACTRRSASTQASSRCSKEARASGRGPRRGERRSSSAARSSTRTRSCSATTRCTRARRHSRGAKPRSCASASACAPAAASDGFRSTVK